MTDRGLVYIATQQDRYVEEAFLSAESAKRHAPGLHITLFTDRTGNALCATGCFDTVEAIAGSGIGNARANAQINRFSGLTRTPYERTLYLDTDTRVVSAGVAALFDRLDNYDVAMAEDSFDTSRAAVETGRRMSNCGVILYRRHHAAAWLTPWHEATIRNLALARQTPVPEIPELAAVADAATRRWLLEVDKIALLSVLPPDAAPETPRVVTLDGSWNWRKPTADVTVNIHHPYDRVESPASEIRRLAEDWMRMGRKTEAQPLLAYLNRVT